MSEFTHVPSAFEELEQEVSANLLADDAVFELVRDELQFDGLNPSLLTDFTVRPYYGGKPPEELGADGATQYIPVSLQISESGNQTALPAIGLKLATYKHISIGAMKKDSSELWLFDEAGRLHQVQRGEDGTFAVGKDVPYDRRRAQAVPVWQDAHNKMIRAARNNSSMRFDYASGLWSDQPETHSSTYPY